MIWDVAVSILLVQCMQPRSDSQQAGLKMRMTPQAYLCWPKEVRLDNAADNGTQLPRADSFLG